MSEQRNGRERRMIADEKLLHRERGVDRIVDFANGVMGFAITLLVVDIRVPEVRKLAGELPRELLDLWPHFIAYIVSFYVIGINWIIYNRIFSHIERYDERLYWLNLLYLFFIAFLPFPTSLVSVYPDLKVAVLLYASTIVCVSLSRTLIWYHATKNNRLVHEDLDPAFVRKTMKWNLAILGGFMVSIGIAFFSPLEAVYLWVVIIIASTTFRARFYR